MKCPDCVDGTYALLTSVSKCDRCGGTGNLPDPKQNQMSGAKLDLSQTPAHTPSSSGVWTGGTSGATATYSYPNMTGIPAKRIKAEYECAICGNWCRGVLISVDSGNILTTPQAQWICHVCTYKQLGITTSPPPPSNPQTP